MTLLSQRDYLNGTLISGVRLMVILETLGVANLQPNQVIKVVFVCLLLMCVHSMCNFEGIFAGSCRVSMEILNMELLYIQGIY